MRSFSTHNGDVVVGKTIELVSDNELLRQKVQRVLGTNLGEWAYDVDEGIDFSVVVCKNPDEAEIMNTIETALKRIDETFAISSFSLKMRGRTAKAEFIATNASGEEVGGEYTYGG